jgi:parallel beta-helix repeat protein
VERLESRTLLTAYYVSPNGDDAATGWVNAPWETLQRAANAVHPGDVVTVRAGTYAGFSLGYLRPQGGTVFKRIVFQGELGAIINQRNEQTDDAIDVEGASFVTVQGFRITNEDGGISRAGIRAVNTNNVIIRNNNIDGMGTWGIFTGFCNYVSIVNNVTSHSQGEHGIYVSNSGDRPRIVGNVVFGNQNCGIHMNGDASEGGDGIISGALVERNIVYGNGEGGGSAINADGVQGSIFRNNLLFGNLASGISLFREDGGAGSNYNVVTNNTIVVPEGARWALNIVNGSIGNRAFNNILVNRDPDHGAINISANSLAGFVSDYI